MTWIRGLPRQSEVQIRRPGDAHGPHAPNARPDATSATAPVNAYTWQRGRPAALIHPLTAVAWTRCADRAAPDGHRGCQATNAARITARRLA